MSARHRLTLVAGEQIPLEPSRTAAQSEGPPPRSFVVSVQLPEPDPPTVAHRIPRFPWPWQPFAAAPVLAWLIVKGGPLGLVLGSVGIVGVAWWLDHWIDRRWEQIKRERGWP